MGGVQLQLEQQHPVVRAWQSHLRHLWRLQALERLHAAPAVRERSHQSLGGVLPPDHVPGGAAGAVVRQPEPTVALQRLPTVSPKGQTQLFPTRSTGHWPGLQTGQIIVI